MTRITGKECQNPRLEWQYPQNKKHNLLWKLQRYCTFLLQSPLSFISVESALHARQCRGERGGNPGGHMGEDFKDFDENFDEGAPWTRKPLSRSTGSSSSSGAREATVTSTPSVLAAALWQWDDSRAPYVSWWHGSWRSFTRDATSVCALGYCSHCIAMTLTVDESTLTDSPIRTLTRAQTTSGIRVLMRPRMTSWLRALTRSRLTSRFISLTSSRFQAKSRAKGTGLDREKHIDIAMLLHNKMKENYYCNTQAQNNIYCHVLTSCNIHCITGLHALGSS